MTGIIASYLKLENIEPEGLKKKLLRWNNFLDLVKSRVAFVVLIASVYI